MHQLWRELGRGRVSKRGENRTRLKQEGETNDQRLRLFSKIRANRSKASRAEWNHRPASSSFCSKSRRSLVLAALLLLGGVAGGVVNLYRGLLRTLLALPRLLLRVARWLRLVL